MKTFNCCLLPLLFVCVPDFNWFLSYLSLQCLSQTSQYTLYSSSSAQYLTSWLLLSLFLCLDKIIWNVFYKISIFYWINVIINLFCQYDYIFWSRDGCEVYFVNLWDVDFYQQSCLTLIQSLAEDDWCNYHMSYTF